MKTKNVLKLLFCMFVGMSITACNDDDEIDLSGYNECTLSFTLSCSDDILNFSTPVVAYVTSDGKEKSIPLTPSDFKNGKCERNVANVELGADLKELNQIVSVKFEPAENAKSIEKESLRYDFEFSAKMTLAKNGKKKTEREAGTKMPGVYSSSSTSHQWTSAAEYIRNLSAEVELNIDGEGKFSWKATKREGESSTTIRGGDGKELSITTITVSVI